MKEFIKGKHEEMLLINEGDKKYNFIPTKSCLDISLPHNYYVLLWTEMQSGPDIVNTQESSEPPLQLEVPYKDIFDKPCKKEFTVEFYSYMNRVEVNFRLNLKHNNSIMWF